MPKYDPYFDASLIFDIPRLEGNEDGTVVIRKIKSRETTSGNIRNQLKYDICESMDVKPNNLEA